MKERSGSPPISSRLPWERVDEAPAGTGICLSGGGLRAASFSFGVLQALQERCGLVYGPASARCMAAVSGGSYIAASYLLGAYHRSLRSAEYETLPPLAEGSPEEEHILSNGQYLTRKKLRYLGFGAVNFTALVALYVWTGTMLANFALLPTLTIESWPSNHWLGSVVHRLPLLLLFLMSVVSWFMLVQCYYTDNIWLPVLGTIVLTVTLQPVLEAAAEHQYWWAWGRMLAIALGLLTALCIVAGLMLLARRAGITGPVASCLNTAAVLTPRLLGLTLLTWSAVWWYRLLTVIINNEKAGVEQPIIAILYLASLISGLLFCYVPHRASLHREYRERLASCFSVARERGAAVKVGLTLLTKLAPPKDIRYRFPRLLVCATANVRRGHATFLPFVLSHDVCGVPGLPQAAFPTAKLELIQEPAGFFTRKTEPLLSLFTAVATTGAAVSPSMGRYTLPSLRWLVAAANIRLGRWLPNPFHPRTREAVCGMTRPGSPPYNVWGRPRTLGPGYDELVPEMLNLNGPRIYVSDGGHYDNLGLLTLLRAKCAEIWCVDASPEPGGEAEELRRVLAVAREEMRIEVGIDLDCFAVAADGFYRATHSAGLVTYPDGSKGRLIIVKLGLTRESPTWLRQLYHTDRGFPHHSTFWNQVYDRNRMDAYRKLGRDSTMRCLNELNCVRFAGVITLNHFGRPEQ